VVQTLGGAVEELHGNEAGNYLPEIHVEEGLLSGMKEQSD
jgi:hypothetical protein